MKAELFDAALSARGITKREYALHKKRVKTAPIKHHKDTKNKNYKILQAA
ncbi:MAG: hypothetical protein IE884_07555 [Sulfuricurvum sp.]|nr:hypothetical protein [Sulfuricurvum sp.]